MEQGNKSGGNVFYVILVLANLLVFSVPAKLWWHFALVLITLAIVLVIGKKYLQ